ncbi:peptide ABC transporter ATP-binding protein [Deinococcus aerolatus]|uniref:Peptide ABC transporter ATP-binding protein n=1 Tax=Deinococcus aerolatus TaxID=522487 RepID=A0ABQ2G9N8_9DEIO|nr:DMT family transporter [Deinococcus aerolatus]GGL82506.1 peptide ABC transporter ATP-binding protein [Deinococcus aerolatus]
MSLSRPSGPAATTLAPLLFVLLWSTGFVGIKGAALNADPFAFLSVRFVLAALLMAGLTLALRAPWPRGRAQWTQAAVSGLLLHAGYLGAVAYGIAQDLPAGVMSVIVGLQPLLTGLLSGPLLGEAVSTRQWAGLGLGFVGVVLVVLGREAGSGAYAAPALLAAVFALLATTLGTLYQRRSGADIPLLGGTAGQYAASAAAMLVLTALHGGAYIHWNTEFIVSLVWLTLALSVGAVLLLLTLIRRMPAARVSSLFYLVPPLVVLQAYVLYGERLTPLALTGLLGCVGGVLLASAAPGMWGAVTRGRAG